MNLTISRLTQYRVARIAAVMGVFLFKASLSAQPGLQAYDRGDLQAVREYLLNAQNETAETLFLRAAITADADSAVEMYRKMVLSYPESPISQRALDRIRQYFYAQGKYDQAAEFEKALKGYRPPKSQLEPAGALSCGLKQEADTAMASESLPDTLAPAKIVGYYLQIGAFSSSANADKLKSTLQKAGYQVEIVGAGQSASRLHAVRVMGFSTEKDALAAAQELRQKHRLSPILVPIMKNP